MSRSLLTSLIVFLIVAVVAPAAAQTRTYYIAADEVTWNYLPLGRDVVGNRPLPPRGPLFLGYRFKKAVYREYTDATFTTMKPRPPSQQYLGILGPVIRAEVGDTIKVVFRNHAHRPYGVHPHGVFYLKSSEGAPYNDGKTKAERLGDAVQPGATYTYVWQVPDRAGPGPNDPSSIIWMYHSHTDEVEDINTGLMGPIIIVARGAMGLNELLVGVDREIITAFEEIGEDHSPYLDENIKAYAKNPAVFAQRPLPFSDDLVFVPINGYIFGTSPMITMHVGEHVRWYLIATMSGGDFHVAHWHGNTVLDNGMRTDTVEIGPMAMKVVDMTPDDPGIWLYHCHVDLHLKFGMSTRYRVFP